MAASAHAGDQRPLLGQLVHRVAHALAAEPAPLHAAVRHVVAAEAGGVVDDDPAHLEPSEGLSRARELQSLGLDVSIVDVQMAKPFTEWPDTQLDSWPMSPLPVYGPARHLDALELHGVPLGSTLRVAGIAEGDQLLGIDGYTLAGDTLQTKLDPNVIRKRGSMVVEIARGDHHVVLSIHWPLR